MNHTHMAVYLLGFIFFAFWYAFVISIWSFVARNSDLPKEQHPSWKFVFQGLFWSVFWPISALLIVWKMIPKGERNDHTNN